jgi:hypothetical protein
METVSRGASTKTIVIVSVCAAALGGMFLYLFLGGTTSTQQEHGREEQNLLEEARKLLAKEPDYNTCRNAVNTINIYYGENPPDPRPTLDPDTRELLPKLFAFSDVEEKRKDELAELDRSAYTLLDAHHLDQCFLLRDVARSLPPSGGTPPEEAAAAFRWVVRQVRLQEGMFPVVPPEFALRRGWGTPLDRALVFVSLLEQLDTLESRAGRQPLRGCLVCWPPARPNDPPQVWACGVMVGDEPNLYLFDPRVGLPLPGREGNGVATLAEVRKDPGLLSALTVDPDNPYDVTAERAREAEIYHYVPLSALAPRMRFFQDTILPRTQRVALAVNAAAERKNLDAAAAACDNPVPVKPWPRGSEDLRAFLPRAEGGSDKPGPNTPAQGFALELVPRAYMPPFFQDQARFPVNIGLGQWAWQEFATPFLAFSLDKEGARELMLRGHQDEAIKKLYGERETTADNMNAVKQLERDPAELTQRVNGWVDEALEAFAAQLKAEQHKDPGAAAAAKVKLDAVWKSPTAEDVKTLLHGAAARKRRPETTYYLALCKHALAELAQARSAPGADPAPEWGEALDWWEKYMRQYSGDPEAWAARRQHGLVLAALGKTDEAVKVWKEGQPDDRRPLDKYEKVGCLYLAKQAKKSPQPKPDGHGP